MSEMRPEIKEIVSMIGNQAFLMLGAYDKVYDNKDCSLGFKIQGSSKFKHVKVKYDQVFDLYDLTFTNYNKYGITKEESVNGLYAEDVHRVIEEKTGLYTYLFKS